MNYGANEVMNSKIIIINMQRKQMPSVNSELLTKMKKQWRWQRQTTGFFNSHWSTYTSLLLIYIIFLLKFNAVHCMTGKSSSFVHIHCFFPALNTYYDYYLR